MVQALNEFVTEFTLRNLLQPLELFLIFYRPDQSLTISVLEKVLDESPNPVLVLDGIRYPLLFLK